MENNKHLIGVTDIMNKQNINRNLDMKQVEHDVLKRNTPIKNIQQSIVLNYEEEIKRMAMEVGMDLCNPNAKIDIKKTHNAIDDQSISTKVSYHPPITHENLATLKDDTPKTKTKSVSSQMSIKPVDDTTKMFGMSPFIPQAVQKTQYISSTVNTSKELTDEHTKRNHISKVLQEIHTRRPNIYSTENEIIKDMKSSKLEQISSMKAALYEEGINTDDIPHVTMESGENAIDDVLNALNMKSNRQRYTTLAQEFIGGVANWIEDIFDGTREIPIVKWKPDYTGYHNSVNTKLNRMRFETSQVVGKILDGNNVSPTGRILLELLPSLILYPSMREKQKIKPKEQKLATTAPNNVYGDIRNKESVIHDWNALKSI